VPQALVYFGVLKYSEQLLKLLKEGTIIPSQDRLEIEIRGSSIWAVEVLSSYSILLTLALLILFIILKLLSSISGSLSLSKCTDSYDQLLRREIQRLITSEGSDEENVNAIIIDFYLWDYAKEHSADIHSIPIHKTRSIFY
jgi:hypothetical protein